jgi:hypothetical protein
MCFMYRIEYEIKLNEYGRPYIELPQDYEHRPEDRFFVIEVARYMLRDLLIRRKSDLNPETVDKMEIGEALLGQLGDEVAAILWQDMKTMGDIDMMLNKKYHFSVNTIEDRDKIGEYIITNEKIYKKSEGLKVLVTEDSIIYEFKDEKWSGANEKTEGSINES